MRLMGHHKSVSLQPSPSKVIENVHKETIKFLNDNNIFYKYQSGFRSKDSTDIFLPFLKDNILKGFDREFILPRS